jgi:putative tricarboxylic transport membrane protein
MVGRDQAGGLALIGFAGAYAFAASDLSMTSSLGIGSGLFPMALAVLLALLGTALLLQSLLVGGRVHDAGNDSGRLAVSLRGLLLIAGAPVMFALLVVPLGVAPALAVSVFASALASRTTSLLAAFSVSAVMVGFCLALFRWALGLPLVMFGPVLVG